MGYYGFEAFDFDEQFDIACSWTYDAKETFPVSKPLDMWRLMPFCNDTQFSAEKLSVPTHKGWAHRMRHGFHSVCRVITTTDEERRQREPIFKERIKPWIDDFGKEWQAATQNAMNYYNRAKQVDLLKINNMALLEQFEEFLDATRRIGRETHWIPVEAVFNIYLEFEGMCKELLGFGDEHPLFQALMGGFGSRTYQSDREFWRLGNRVRELDLEKVFKDIPDNETLLSHLESLENGRKWLRELKDVLWEEGWRCPGKPCEFSNPSWVEEPKSAMGFIRGYMSKAEKEFAFDQSKRHLEEKRKKAEKECLAKIPAVKKSLFTKMLKSAQWQGRINEEHQFYCESYWNAMGRRITKEIGERLVRRGIFNDFNDVYYLLPDEIISSLAYHGFNAQRLVGIRKKQYEEYCIKAREPLVSTIIGNPEELMKGFQASAFSRILLPIKPPIKEELKADFYGMASSPGVVEGTARVILSEAEFGQVQAGELLVCGYSNPLWTPLFPIVKGLAVDWGGTLSHAVIIGREVGIPVVAGIQEGTRKIKTGDRIRIDGDNGVVYILERNQSKS